MFTHVQPADGFLLGSEAEASKKLYYDVFVLAPIVASPRILLPFQMLCTFWRSYHDLHLINGGHHAQSPAHLQALPKPPLAKPCSHSNITPTSLASFQQRILRFVHAIRAYTTKSPMSCPFNCWPS
jgi:hypothetical protein